MLPPARAVGGADVAGHDGDVAVDVVEQRVEDDRLDAVVGDGDAEGEGATGLGQRQRAGRLDQADGRQDVGEGDRRGDEAEDWSTPSSSRATATNWF